MFLTDLNNDQKPLFNDLDKLFGWVLVTFYLPCTFAVNENAFYELAK